MNSIAQRYNASLQQLKVGMNLRDHSLGKSCSGSHALSSLLSGYAAVRLNEMIPDVI
jgi:hypothetical protein